MIVLEERGLFWWAEEAVPPEQIAPTSNAAGSLRIESNGRCSLDLIGYPPSAHGPMAGLVEHQLPEKQSIRGLLKTGEHVLLMRLTRYGNFTTSGISSERYEASACLVSAAGADVAEAPFAELIVPMSGYEQWLRLRSLTIVETARTQAAKYRRPAQKQYRIADGTLTFQFALDGPGQQAVFGVSVAMRETASATFKFAVPISLSDVMTKYNSFEDFLVLLSGGGHALDWPWLISSVEHRSRLYFRKARDQTTTSPPQYYECITHFPQLSGTFGSIWSKWSQKLEELRPGFVLYLATRRGMTLYVEHRFVSLVWGLEALHRRKHPSSNASPLQAKVNRIVEQVKANKDKKWLRRLLKDAHEPSLGERISAILGSLPLNLDKQKIRTFSDRCATLRNELSHFGGHRDKNEASIPLPELHQKSEALTDLYQLILLQEIGIDAAILMNWVNTGPRSYPIKMHLASAGLIDMSDVTTPGSQPHAGSEGSNQ